MQNIKYLIKVLFTPACWLTVGTYDKAHDEWLKENLKNPVFEKGPSGYVVILNGMPLWVSNYPYAYGSLCSEVMKPYSRCEDCPIPSRAAMLQLGDAIKDWNTY